MPLNIYQRRKELGLTLEDIAKAVGVSKSTVKKWESGYIKNMRRDKIASLAKILNISPIDILQIENDISDTSLKIYPLTASQQEALKDILGIESFKNRVYIIKNNYLYSVLSEQDFQQVYLNQL